MKTVTRTLVFGSLAALNSGLAYAVSDNDRMFAALFLFHAGVATILALGEAR